jgi:hypothetical protein
MPLLSRSTMSLSTMTLSTVCTHEKYDTSKTAVTTATDTTTAAATTNIVATTTVDTTHSKLLQLLRPEALDVAKR